MGERPEDVDVRGSLVAGCRPGQVVHGERAACLRSGGIGLSGACIVSHIVAEDRVHRFIATQVIEVQASTTGCIGIYEAYQQSERIESVSLETVTSLGCSVFAGRDGQRQRAAPRDRSNPMWKTRPCCNFAFCAAIAPFPSGHGFAVGF